VSLLTGEANGKVLSAVDRLRHENELRHTRSCPNRQMV
jgi:hypothetical protein